MFSLLWTFALATAVVRATDFSLCGDDKLHIHEMNVLPDPLEPGEAVVVSVISAKGADVELTDGDSLLVELYVLGMKVGHVALDLCGGGGSSLLSSCPVPAGQPFSGSMRYSIPSDAPRGVQVGTQIHVLGSRGDSLSCVQLDVRIRSSDELLEQVSEDAPAITQSLIRQVERSPVASWTAHASPRFPSVYSVRDVKRIASGSVLRGQSRDYIELPRKLHAHSPLEEIPISFDSAAEWPHCAHLISTPRDQSDCGSCWAFATTEAFGDRRCIAGMESSAIPLSAEDTTACCSGIWCGFSQGCNGGQPAAAWEWFSQTGVVSGGDYGEADLSSSCKPYEFPPCAHHVDPPPPGLPACQASEYPSPECRTVCSNVSYPVAYDADKRMATSAYSLRTVEDIQRDILEFGPVTAAFSVYSDFPAYHSGVYEQVTGTFMGGHAVKITGWGVDEGSGKPYWIVVNSWGPSWGQDGIFWILRGVNECGIEGEIVAGEVV